MKRQSHLPIAIPNPVTVLPRRVVEGQRLRSRDKIIKTSFPLVRVGGEKVIIIPSGRT